ncbi:hypothetical protein KJ688_06335 [bacterium]|nr:hypothetical protein [bacterium]
MNKQKSSKKKGFRLCVSLLNAFGVLLGGRKTFSFIGLRLMLFKFNPFGIFQFLIICFAMLFYLATGLCSVASFLTYR